jgi:hypothetical protein
MQGGQVQRTSSPRPALRIHIGTGTQKKLRQFNLTLFRTDVKQGAPIARRAENINVDLY